MCVLAVRFFFFKNTQNLQECSFCDRLRAQCCFVVLGLSSFFGNGVSKKQETTESRASNHRPVA